MTVIKNERGDLFLRHWVTSPDAVGDHVTIPLLIEGEPTEDLLALNRALIVAEQYDQREARLGQSEARRDKDAQRRLEELRPDAGFY